MLPSVISRWILFFGESMYFFRTAKSLNVLRNVSVSVDFYCKVATASQFFQFRNFCSKNPFFILKKPEVWTSENCYNFSRFYGKFAAFAILKDFSFSRKTEVFFNTSKSQNLNVLRNLTNSFALYSNFVTISDFWKFQSFYRKTHLFCKKHNFWTLWEISLFRSHSTSKWLTVSVAVDIKLAKLSCFQKFKFLFRKNNYFRIQFVEKSYWLLRFWGNFATFIHLTKQLKIFSRETHLFLRKTNFQRFEKSYCFSLIQQQNWYL